MKMLLSSLLLSVVLLCSSKGVAGDEVVRIKNAEDFKTFVSNVNSGTNYSGTTVYLDSDLSLSEATDPIGINKTHHFRGTFDGQGHTISNLNISTYSEYVGLFGYSGGLTIKNVVLNSSCTITSSYNGSYLVYIGGAIGYCLGQCNIENSVNMANVTFSGRVSSTSYHDLYLGGIAGYLLSFSECSAYVRNCMNYGSITDSGKVGHNAYLSGIVGFTVGFSNKYIQNCLNYGTITYSGSSDYLKVGGVVGYGYHTYIENCVSAGEISMLTTATGDNYIGGIAGEANTNTYINYCYYTGDVNASSIYGTGTPNSTTGSSISSTSVDSTLISQLNSNATSCNWNKWLLNTKNKIVAFKMGDDKNISFSSQIILIPNPVKEGHMFLFWCKGKECTEEFDPVTEQINDDITLYAHWEEVTTQVEIIFSTKDLTQEEVEKLIEQYTKAEHEITKFESESGGIRVIIEFSDKENAKNFIKNIKESSEATDLIQKISFVSGGGSFSTTAYPPSFFSFLL